MTPQTFRMRGKTLMRAAAVTALVLAGTAAHSQPDKSMLVVGQLQFLKNFHPLIQVNNTKRLQVSYGLLPITGFDEHQKNQCVLCETLPTLNNGLAKIVDK